MLIIVYLADIRDIPGESWIPECRGIRLFAQEKIPEPDFHFFPSRGFAIFERSCEFNGLVSEGCRILPEALSCFQGHGFRHSFPNRVARPGSGHELPKDSGLPPNFP